MKLKEVKLSRFKRFSDTWIKDIPESVQLVIIAGPNGSGKSSFFEALNSYNRSARGRFNWSTEYYVKNPELGAIHLNKAVEIIFHDPQPTNRAKAFYFRSAYRNDAEFNVRSIETPQALIDEDRLPRLIENDQTVGRNYQRLTAQALADVFEREAGTTTIAEFRTKVIGEIRQATERLFPGLVLNGLGNPLTTGTFKFDKGSAAGFQYMNLSGGEKAAFDLLLDMIVKRKEFDDTIFCIDEPEAHINGRLQGKLLTELYNVTGSTSQLWLATHSIGMMRSARDIASEFPEKVAFLDFGGRNFDEPQVIVPEVPNRRFWERVLDVAFDDYASLIVPRRIVLCEGAKPNGASKREAADAKIYDVIFGAEFPEVRFVSVGNNDDVLSDNLALVSVIQSLVSGANFLKLIDRDDMSDAELNEFNNRGIAVLPRRHIESYLFGDEVLQKLCAVHGRGELVEEVLASKNLELEKAAADRGRPVDDVKASAGPIMNMLKQKLRLTQCGATLKEFMRITLAPLITPETTTYAELRGAIFGR